MSAAPEFSVSVLILLPGSNQELALSSGANHADLKSKPAEVFCSPRILRCPRIISQWWISGTIALLVSSCGTSSQVHLASAPRGVALPVARNAVLQEAVLRTGARTAKSSGSVKLALLGEYRFRCRRRAIDRSRSPEYADAPDVQPEARSRAITRLLSMCSR